MDMRVKTFRWHGLFCDYIMTAKVLSAAHISIMVLTVSTS
jgi:hypothetical protein